QDIVVVRASFVKSDPMMLKVKIEGLDAVPNVPDYTAAGDLDADGVVDVVSIFRRPGTVLQYGIWAALGREHDGRRITGDIDLSDATLRTPAMVLADLDGDGIDDIVVVEIAAAGSPSRVQIYSMGLPH